LFYPSIVGGIDEKDGEIEELEDKANGIDGDD